MENEYKSVCSLSAKKKPELRNLLFRTYEELAKDQIPVQMENYEQVYLGTMKPGETPEQIKRSWRRNSRTIIKAMQSVPVMC